MSGGGGGNTYYANQDKLLGAQADIATGVYNSVYQPYAPQAVGEMASMAKDAQDGTLTNQARATAGADAGASLGNALGAATRATDRFGATINPNAMAHDTTTAALGGAAMRDGAMNQATQWGNQQGWARTNDLYNSIQGVPTNSADQLGSAASSYGQAGAAATQNASTAAGGLASLGMMAAKGMKDGGEVKSERGLRRRLLENGELHMAAGGVVPYLPKVNVGGMNAASNPGQLSRADAVANLALPVAAEVAGQKIIAPAVSSGMNMLGNAAAKGIGTLAGNILPASTQAAAPVATAAVTPVATGATTDAAATGAAATGAGTSAGLTAASMATPLGWGLAGLAATRALGLWKADGGSISGAGLKRAIVSHGAIPRKDLRPGGAVRGPGTATSDSVPAQLSDGEFVLNAEAVKLAGKAKLEKLNQRGLAARQRKVA